MEALPAQPPANRYSELDLLRFLAAFSVLLFHFTFRGYAADHFSPVRYAGLESVTKYGYLGVELFFIISGYVVLLSAYSKTALNFVLSRIIRLYPAFWVACTATFLVVYFFGPAKNSVGWSVYLDVSPRQYVVNMTMFHEFLHVQSIDGIYWTLTYELRFYLIIFLVLLFGLQRHLPLLLVGWVAYAALSLVYKLPLSSYLMPDYGPLFISGMCFLLLQKQLANRWLLYGLLLVCWGLTLQTEFSNAQHHITYYQTAFSLYVIGSVVSLFYGLFWVISTRRVTLRQRPWLYWAGALTYPLYLVHHNIGYILFQRINNALPPYLLLALITLFMVGLAYGLHVFIEKPGSALLSAQLARFGHRTRAVV